MPNCEICGVLIRGQVFSVQVEGAILRVCGLCSRLGSSARIPKEGRPRLSPKATGYTIKEPEFELREDYPKAIRQAREKLNLTQEELARRINEKLSVIKHLESGKLKPDNLLTKKLEHSLKMEIFVPVEGEV